MLEELYPGVERGTEKRKRECWILNLIHVERNAQNCTCETSVLHLDSSVFAVLNLEDISDQALPLNLEMMGKSRKRWG